MGRIEYEGMEAIKVCGVGQDTERRWERGYRAETDVSSETKYSMIRSRIPTLNCELHV